MNRKINLLLLFFCLLLISCTTTPTELKVAKQLIESKPDSALKILQRIKPQNIKSVLIRHYTDYLKLKLWITITYYCQRGIVNNPYYNLSFSLNLHSEDNKS